jgi:lipoprotein-anchoring transpeptidase ErfK/SrfK
MSEDDLSEARNALIQAQEEIRQGRTGQAYWWAARAARLAPQLEEPWLLLASLASPQASVSYMQRALQINPASPRALKGLEWARQRENTWRASQLQPSPLRNEEVTAKVLLPAKPVRTQRKSRLNSALPYLAALFVIMAVLLVISAVGVISLLRLPTPVPALASLNNPPAAAQPVSFPQVVSQATSTNIPVNTPTTLPTTPTVPTSGPTATPQPAPTATAVPVVMPTFISAPKLAQNPGAVNQGAYLYPAAPGGNHPGRWIDVSLNHQMAYAYEGNKVVRSFLVSTGVAAYPTVRGQYRIYVKLRYDDMKGPGYNLKNVPYVMYFYKGYSLHGTYWHHNFGTPMSHGCVNMYTPDAAWLYSWASVGTLVNVHY